MLNLVKQMIVTTACIVVWAVGFIFTLTYWEIVTQVLVAFVVATLMSGLTLRFLLPIVDN